MHAQWKYSSNFPLAEGIIIASNAMTIMVKLHRVTNTSNEKRLGFPFSFPTSRNYHARLFSNIKLVARVIDKPRSDRYVKSKENEKIKFHFSQAKPSASVAVLPALLAKSSICYNPIIYAGLNSQFPRSLKKIFDVRPARSSVPGSQNTALTNLNRQDHRKWGRPWKIPEDISNGTKILNLESIEENCKYFC